MKLNFTEFGRKWQFAVMEASGFLSIALVLAQMFTPENPWPVVWIAAAYGVFALLTLIAPGKIRLALGLVCCAALMALGFALLEWLTSLLVLIVPVMYCVLLILGLPVGGLTRDGSLPSLFTIGPLAMQVLTQIILFFNKNTHGQPLSPVQPGLNAAFLVYALMAAVSLNRFSLAIAAAKGNPAPRSVRRRNLLMTLALGAITLAIACMPALAAFLKRVGQAIGIYLIRFILWLGGLFASESSGGTGGGMGQMLMPGAADEKPGLFAVVLEKVAIVLTILIALVLLFFGLRVLFRKLRVLFRLLMERLSRFAAGAAEDYIDEISDTRDDGEHTRLWARLRRKPVDPLKGIDETKLAPRERVRFHYRRLLLRHPEWEPGVTARETLAEPAAAIYEKARYSPHPITPSEQTEFASDCYRTDSVSSHSLPPL